MTLEEVLERVPVTGGLPDELARHPVSGLDYDSRRIGKGFLFFAFRGEKADGRQFAQSTIERGALAVVSDQPKLDNWTGEWLQVADGRRALAVAASNFYGQPDQRLGLTGITGTNGKTTTAFLLDSILRAAGSTTALVSTIEYHLGDRVLPAVNTTPESLDLFRLFHDLLAEGGTHATMEVSSHALGLGRVYGIHYHTAVFTNLTQDHLDFHHTMDEYFQAKELLFHGTGAPPPQYAVINKNDPYGRKIRTSAETQVITYGLDGDATVHAGKFSSTFEGLHFEIRQGNQTTAIRSSMVGKINVYNILAAYAAGVTYGLQPEVIAGGIAACRSVPGRFERVDEGQPFLVIVDYAHTSDALRNLIQVARSLSPKRVITVFGCGGDRDRSKRPLMGEAASDLSDFVVVTSDNPRSEDPISIINDALVGVRRHDTRHAVEPDRASAIRIAIEEARSGDIVLIAGKGHETYQVLKDGVIPYDDRETARKILRSFGYGQAKA